jgi:hypothetical protein
MFESMTFLSPWILGALALIPILWWVLRLLPPRPRTLKFPAFFLLRDLEAKIKSPAHTPWWLLVLRSLMALFLVLALADPVLHPQQMIAGNPSEAVLLVVDNGWASAAGWKARQEKLGDYITQLKRNNRAVILLPTAPSDIDGKIHVYGEFDAKNADEYIRRLKPQPWETAHGDALTAAKEFFKNHKASHTIFVSDGTVTSGDDTKALLDYLDTETHGLTVVTDNTINNSYVLKQSAQKPTALEFSIERLNAETQDKPLRLAAWSPDGALVDELKITYPKDTVKYTVSWDMAVELKNKTARIALNTPEMASTVFLTNARWRQHPVAIAADSAQKESQSFLNDIYYLKHALEDGNKVTVDNLDVILKQSLSAVILSDTTLLNAEQKTALQTWVEQGGFLIRFAGANLTANAEDGLLPVTIRNGGRSMTGAMTWEKPLHLGAISDKSPLYGLAVPPDVTVTKQVLAEPTPDSFEKTWLQLEDGTPLITGGKIGKGTVVLVHTTAGPEWSNFCYSGLYVEALQRMISLSNGISDYKTQSTLSPLQVMDGFGKLWTPDSKSIITAIEPDKTFTPSPQTPAGLYGDAHEFKAFNLADSIYSLKPLEKIPSSATIEPFQKSQEISLKPMLLKIVIGFLLIETAVTFWMRGIIFVFACLMFFQTATAQAAEFTQKDLVSGIYLAYIETGDEATDTLSYHGLQGLGAVISARTTIKIKDVAALNPDSDLLAFYPFIYWPITDSQTNLSATAARNIQNYLAQGGMILFDTRDQQFGGDNAIGAQKLRELTKNIQIPDITEIPEGHILSRSFYLLDAFQGRYTGGKLWVEKEPNPHHDGVSSVIIGSNDWAAAWTNNPEDRDHYAIESGGERQREMAYRFGVNVLMVALTGNYKADQVHIPAILERLGR